MFAQPVAVDDSLLISPSDVAHLMPLYEDIPGAFRVEGRGGPNPYVAFQREWFFSGLEGVVITAKPGIDGEAALRHLTAILRARNIPCEHKEASMAYLASLWLELPKQFH